MTFELNAAFSLSVGIGAVIGWVRVKKTDPAFLPFLILIWLGFTNEILSIILMKAGYSNAVYYNIFSLLEALIVNWQFRRWGLYGNNKRMYYIVQFLFVAGWVTEILTKGSIHTFNSYFIICYSTIIVILAINIVNKEMFKEPSSLLMNPVFLVCLGLIMYLTYTILVEIFWVYGLNSTKVFRVRIYEIFAYINLLTNLIFAFAILWIPMKRQYILQS
jgi:hypothetical protein